MATQQKQAGAERLSLFLGCFSLGLGIAELAAPRAMANLIGIDDTDKNRNVLRGFGAREIAAGIGILMQPDQPKWLWARVAGDALDLTSLGIALAGDSNKSKAAFATAAVAGVTALDVLCAQKLSNQEQTSGASASQPEQFTRTVLINRSPDDVYQFWRNFSNLPVFMDNLESVQDLSDNRSLWRARVVRGRTIEWQAEITEDQPGRLISWRSLPGAVVSNSGTVEFSPGPGQRGTMVRVEIRYRMLGGSLTATLAKLVSAEPGQQVADELRRLKMVLETGEVVRSDASIHPGMHPAQPVEKVPQAIAATV